MDVPDVRYAWSGDVAIAYQVVGDGPVDLVFVRGFVGDLLSAWDQPLLLRHILGLASFARVIMLDKRGTGLSDRTTALPTLETRLDDLRAVMDDAGSERAVLWSAHEGSRLAVLFAATYPERTVGLILFDPEPRGLRADDYPWAPTEAEWRQELQEVGGVGHARVPGAARCALGAEPRRRPGVRGLVRHAHATQPEPGRRGRLPPDDRRVGRQ